MLGFNMETRRIVDIIKAGAATKLTDMQFLEREISRFMVSRDRKEMITGYEYYDYQHEVVAKKREVIGADGKLTEDDNLPNNRLMDNVYATMVDQKVNYLMSKPITYQTEDKAYADALARILNKRFGRLIKNLAKDAYNCGIGWIYPYYDEKGALKIKKFHPWEILPFWKDDEHSELDFAIRIYDVLAYEGQDEKVLWYVEVYDTNGIHRFEWKDGKLIPDYSTSYFELSSNEVAQPYNWDRVPLIAFRANSAERPLLRRCKCLQDALNYLLSTFVDGMEENASGNTVLVIHNYGGTNLGEFRRNLMQYKAVKVNSVDGTDGGIDTLQIEVNADNYKAIISELRKAMISNCKGYDVEELKSAGSPNEMTIKAVFSSIDMDANEIETEFQASFEDLLWFLTAHFKNTGVGDFDGEDVSVIFNRDMMISESSVISDIKQSVGILSDETLVAQHPWVVDTAAELERIKKQKEDNIEMYGFAQGQQDDDDGADREE